MWVNHHHMLPAARRADARLLWSNNFLLFWMSLVPFVTAFMGNDHGDPRAAALYGVGMSLCSMAFALLRTVIAQHPSDNPDLLDRHRRMRFKNLYSFFLYAASVPLAFVEVRISFSFLSLLRGPIFCPNAP